MMAGARILVVEDNLIVAKNMKSRLAGSGYTVPGIAISGEEAIQCAAETHPDLVLMDIKLKGEMDGIEAAEKIHTRFGIPVIYLTGYPDDETLQPAKGTESFGYVSKPFEIRKLCRSIEMALSKHETDKKLSDLRTTG